MRLFELILFIVMIRFFISIIRWSVYHGRTYRPYGMYYRPRPHVYWHVGPRPPMGGPMGPVRHHFGPGPGGFGGHGHPGGFGGGHGMGSSFGGSSRGAGAGRH